MTPLKFRPSQARRLGLGAGILGAILVALKYALRPPTKRRVPDAISPAVFATKVLHTSLGAVVYHEAGSGPVLVFVHDIGLGASSFEWAKVYPEFAATHRVIALDLVGFGESERPDIHYSAADYVRMLAEFVRALAFESPPVLIASGLGAGLCVLLASQHPEMVARLILHMPSGTGELGRQPLAWFTRLVYRTPLLARFLYRNHLSTKSAVAHWLRRAAFLDPAKVSEETIDVFTTCAQQPGAEHATLAWLGGRLSFDLEHRFQSLSQPIALLWSSEAPGAPVELAHHLQKLSPAASLAVFPDAGPLAAIEVPQAMTDALREHLHTEIRVLKAG